MIIDYVEGDLLKAPYKYIAHGCNAQGRMASGVAKLIRAKWPKAYEDYINEWTLLEETRGKANIPELLGRNVWSEQPDGKVIINMITQNHYGYDNKRYVSYDAIASCFEAIGKNVAETVAIPKIGAGLGGGEWTIICRIIDSVTPLTKIIVYELVT